MDEDKYRNLNRLQQSDYATLLDEIKMVTFSIVNYELFTKSEEYR